MTNNIDVHDNELIRTTYEQLMQHVRKQDDLIHSWTKYYLSIQAALAIALSFLIKLENTEKTLVNMGSLLIPFLGIVTSIYLTNIILREQLWQGRYVWQIMALPKIPKTYLESWLRAEPNPNEHGYVGKQFLKLRIALIVGWAVVFLLLIYRAI